MGPGCGQARVYFCAQNILSVFDAACMCMDAWIVGQVGDNLHVGDKGHIYGG